MYRYSSGSLPDNGTILRLSHCQWRILKYMGKISWWRHQMETFSALLAICAGNSPVPGEFPAQRPVTRSFAVFCDLRRNKRLSKQWWGWWFGTPSCPLWRHHDAVQMYGIYCIFHCNSAQTYYMFIKGNTALPYSPQSKLWYLYTQRGRYRWLVVFITKNFTKPVYST